MRVFITGGTGLIGSAVVAELLANDHTVLALARSDRSALALKSAGAGPIRGDLADLDALRSGAAQSDGVIHLAFGHDFSSPDAIARAVAEESSALATLGEELLGSDRPLVTVSGTPRAVRAVVMATARPTLLRASRSWSSELAATAAFMRGPSSRFIGPIAFDTRFRPAATASRGLASPGASAIPSASNRLSVCCPAIRTSRLSGK